MSENSNIKIHKKIYYLRKLNLKKFLFERKQIFFKGISNNLLEK